LSQTSLDFIVKNSKHLKILFALIESKKVVLSNELLDFIIMHPKEVLTWLNSLEFKQKYLDTDHPYPPLLNPTLLNGEGSFENDGLANSKGEACFEGENLGKAQTQPSVVKNSPSHHKP
ncbi:hypothetical protein DMC01_08490, partial [Campylobacter troglodytis]